MLQYTTVVLQYETFTISVGMGDQLESLCGYVRVRTKIHKKRLVLLVCEPSILSYKAVRNNE
jgi:hypothetical protein